MSDKVMKDYGIFKERTRIWVSPFDKTFKRQIVEYQCPVCKRWFNSYYSGWNTLGVRQHITRIGKSEAVAKALGELKKMPHFLFWRANTQPVEHPHKPREWILY